MRFVDSHAHLVDAAFDHDREDVIDRARDAGARAVVCIGESVGAAERALALAGRYSGFIFSTAGIHPHDAASYEAARDLPRVRELIQRGAVAVGECGLDYHHDRPPREVQRRVFADQLALAGELACPVVMHTRNAEADTAAMLAEAAVAGVRGVLHCFTGTPTLGEAALAAGWMLSFSGIITFKKWVDDALLCLAPYQRLLAESDAPYLAPVPHRGKRNEPAFVTLTVARLAAARGVDPALLGEQVAANASRLFRLATEPAARLES